MFCPSFPIDIVIKILIILPRNIVNCNITMENNNLSVTIRNTLSPITIIKTYIAKIIINL